MFLNIFLNNEQFEFFFGTHLIEVRYESVNPAFRALNCLKK